MRYSSNRPSRSALRTHNNVSTPCMNVSQYANVADCILPAAVNSRCSACKVAMCSDSSCLDSSRTDALYPDANACWMSLTSLVVSFLLRSVWSRCCIDAQNASWYSRYRASSMSFILLFPLDTCFPSSMSLAVGGAYTSESTSMDRRPPSP